MTIVGLGGLMGDAACAVLREGKLVAAVEQKKIARRHEPGQLPAEAIHAALRLADVAPEQVEAVALALPLGPGQATALHLAVRSQFPKSRLVLVDHHRAHAASAFYASPFEDATVLTLDRAGDFRCGALWRGAGVHLDLERELYFPDSLGDLYGRVTELLGFRAGAEEHKVQWLSASGEPSFPVFDEILGAPEWPRIERTFLDSSRMSRGGFSARFYQALGLPDEAPVPAELRATVAASLQKAVENAVARMAGEAPRLCLAGGLAFNALLVAALERQASVFVQPAAGNAGLALGAAYHAWHHTFGGPRLAPLGDLFLGPGFSAPVIKQVLENCKLRFHYLATGDELVDTAVRVLEENKIIAWMQGRMEFGPRALGNRSILASPRDAYSSENLNTYIKHREPFRKFAASVPAECANEYFTAGPNARFLATVGTVRPAWRDTFSSAILSGDKIRVHTVEQTDNPLFHRLLHAAGKVTGLPVLYNTSFNLFGDPLVCTPRDAVRSFYSSGIDALFAGNFYLEK